MNKEIDNLEDIYFGLNKLNNDYIDLVDKSVYNPKTKALLDSLKDINNSKFKNSSEELLTKLDELKKEGKDKEKEEKKEEKEENMI